MTLPRTRTLLFRALEAGRAYRDALGALADARAAAQAVADPTVWRERIAPLRRSFERATERGPADPPLPALVASLEEAEAGLRRSEAEYPDLAAAVDDARQAVADAREAFEVAVAVHDRRLTERERERREFAALKQLLGDSR